MSTDDVDEFRYWLSDERIYRFLLTQVITYVHIFFEYLGNFNLDLSQLNLDLSPFNQNISPHL